MKLEKITEERKNNRNAPMMAIYRISTQKKQHINE